MIRRPITLILGAGASVPYGYPTGAELIEQIVGLLNWRVATATKETGLLRDAVKPEHQAIFSEFHIKIAEFCYAVKRHRPTNIDSFLRDSPSLEDLGRKIIAYLIRKTEFNDYGAIVPPDISSAPWYQLLLEALVSRVEPKDIAGSHGLRIITFNYDVSLEYFLATALLGYERTQKVAKQIFDSIPIVHMFGKVGEVSIENDMVKYEYGKCGRLQYDKGSFIDERVWKLCEGCNLHVAIETKHKHKDVMKASGLAKSYLEEADHVLCMGFDFALDNCDLLDMPEEFWIHHPTFYLNHQESPNLDRRVQAMRKTATNLSLLKASSCYDALTLEYDLTRA